MKRPIIAKEGWPFIAFFALVTILIGLLYPPGLIFALLLLALTLWFFRDPEVAVPAEERQVVSPADGRVMFVREVEEPRFVGGKAIMISIFLSIFDIHVNRMPVAGTIAYKEYVSGKFLAAWDDTVGEVNERSYIGIDHGKARILVSQVAGLVARRIFTWPVVGAKLTRGERFGLIRFGSCTQVWIPVGSEVLVKPGDRVKGGVSVLGRLPM